jgi:signal transduction histidine kinase
MTEVWVRRAAGRYAWALCLTTLALGTELLLVRFAGTHFIFLAFSLAIALSALAGGLGPALLATGLSALLSHLFLIGPGAFIPLQGAVEALVLGSFVAAWTGVALVAGVYVRRVRDWRGRTAEAELIARQRDRFAQLVSALNSARTPADVLEAIVQEPLHAMAADGAILLQVSDDGGSATVTRTLGRVEQGRVFSCRPDDRSAVTDAVARAAPMTFETRRECIERYPGTPEDLLAGESIALVPVGTNRHVAAVLILPFGHARTFEHDDSQFLEAVGMRGGQALHRARAHESSDRARIEAEALRARADQELAERQRTEAALRVSETRYRALAARTARMHDLTAALSEAVTIDAVAHGVVTHARIAVGATAAEVLLLADEGTQFRTVYADNDLPEYRPVEPGLAQTDAIQTREPVFIRSFAEWQERSWQSASLAADRSHVSSAALPLLVEGTPIGVLAFHFSAPVNFDADYRILLVSVAQHCAQALDRARLYDSAQRAQGEAEAASREKDHFLSIVSHELRTPLNAILGWASMLQEEALNPVMSDRAVRSIHTNATRQSRLIDELLDSSRIVAGRMKLEFEEVEVPQLLNGVIESLLPMAASNGLEISCGPIPPARLFADVRRLEQVFLNLLTNALKFTRAGGRITVEARQADNDFVVSISDNGIGIDAAFLPHVFDRFRQAESATTGTTSGLGLGLSIAKQLVEAHKGTISVESAGVDRGSRFTVTLPIASALRDRPAGRTTDTGWTPETPARAESESPSVSPTTGGE